MLNVVVAVSLPPLLVFGLYHLMSWFNILNINDRDFWRRVALASALSHVLLATGFFVFSYVDYRINREITSIGLTYGAFLFNRSEFWRFVTIFDTAAMVCIVGFFSVLDRLGIVLPAVLPLTIAITYVLGTIQWYFVGGGLGAIVDRFWSGLKSGSEEEKEWDDF